MLRLNRLRSYLHRERKKVGAYTPRGHRYSNIAQLARNYDLACEPEIKAQIRKTVDRQFCQIAALNAEDRRAAAER